MRSRSPWLGVFLGALPTGTSMVSLLIASQIGAQCLFPLACLMSLCSITRSHTHPCMSAL